MQKKILIIGVPGAGKTHLCKQILLQSAEIKYLELDRVYWKADWIRNNQDDFKFEVRNFLKNKKILIDGIYPEVIEDILEEIDTIIWLKPNFLVSWSRVLLRSIKLCISGEELWNGNKETLSRLLSSNSMPIYALFKHNHIKNQLNKLIDTATIRGVSIIPIHSKADMNHFIKNGVI